MRDFFYTLCSPPGCFLFFNTDIGNDVDVVGCDLNLSSGL